MKAAEELGQRIGVSAACRALNVSRATFYRRRNTETETRLRPKPARALSNPERKEVLSQLNSDRFADQSPRQVYAQLLDEGQYLCSVRTRYRILEDNQLLCERRNQRTHPNYRKPELLASGPNEVWSWDITKLKGRKNGLIIICTRFWTSTAALTFPMTIRFPRASTRRSSTALISPVALAVTKTRCLTAGAFFTGTTKNTTTAALAC